MFPKIPSQIYKSASSVEGAKDPYSSIQDPNLKAALQEFIEGNESTLVLDCDKIQDFTGLKNFADHITGDIVINANGGDLPKSLFEAIGNLKITELTLHDVLYNKSVIDLLGELSPLKKINILWAQRNKEDSKTLFEKLEFLQIINFHDEIFTREESKNTAFSDQHRKNIVERKAEVGIGQPIGKESTKNWHNDLNTNKVRREVEESHEALKKAIHSKYEYWSSSTEEFQKSLVDLSKKFIQNVLAFYKLNCQDEALNSILKLMEPTNTKSLGGKLVDSVTNVANTNVGRLWKNSNNPLNFSFSLRSNEENAAKSKSREEKLCVEVIVQALDALYKAVVENANANDTFFQKVKDTYINYLDIYYDEKCYSIDPSQEAILSYVLMIYQLTNDAIKSEERALKFNNIKALLLKKLVKTVCEKKQKNGAFTEEDKNWANNSHVKIRDEFKDRVTADKLENWLIKFTNPDKQSNDNQLENLFQ